MCEFKATLFKLQVLVLFKSAEPATALANEVGCHAVLLGTKTWHLNVTTLAEARFNDFWADVTFEGFF